MKILCLQTVCWSSNRFSGVLSLQLLGEVGPVCNCLLWRQRWCSWRQGQRFSNRRLRQRLCTSAQRLAPASAGSPRSPAALPQRSGSPAEGQRRSWLQRIMAQVRIPKCWEQSDATAQAAPTFACRANAPQLQRGNLTQQFGFVPLGRAPTRRPLL